MPASFCIIIDMTNASVDSLGPYGAKSLVVEFLGLEDLDGPTMCELAELYPRAYHNSEMYVDLLKDIARDPKVFMLTIARENYAPGTGPDEAAAGPIIGARLIRDTPPDDDEDHFGYPAVHGSRFCVDPESRGLGVGSAILQAGNRHCFDELKIPVVFGSSNEVGAMRMYGHNGAMFHEPSIEAYGSDRNSPEVSLRAFATLVTSRSLYGYRMTGGQHIRYAYAGDNGTAEDLERLRFYPIEHIIARAGLKHLLETQ